MGVSWTKPIFRQGHDVLGIHPSGKAIYAASRLGGILLSEDSGFTWKGLASPGARGDTFRDVFRWESVLLAGSYYRGIYRSLDTGRTWVRAEGPSNTGVFADFAAIGSTLIAGSIYDGVHLSVDSGKSWSKAAETPGGAKSINSMAVDDQRVLVVDNGGRLFLSLDTCKTWRGLALEGGVHINNVVTWKEWMVVGTKKQGLWFTEDNGASWNRLGTGLPDSLGVNNLAAGDGMVYAATTDWALWRLEVSPQVTTLRRGPRDGFPRWLRMGPTFPWTLDGRLRGGFRPAP
jgi:hypothetical protein